uniref:Uncharacterized protein n=1 Tax=Zea mays TaxID=4577 RepID=A0A804MWM6_MAIZE
MQGIGSRFAGLQLVFSFTSLRVTRVGEARKRALDPEFKEGGQHNWKQVLSNSGIASISIHGHLSSTFFVKLSHKLSQHSRVRKATIGGVTIDGLLVAAAGFLIGLAFVLIRFFTTQCAPDFSIVGSTVFAKR